MMDTEIKQAVKKELAGLVTPTEAAALKEMSLNTFKYRVAKPGGPEQVAVGDGHVFYRRAEVMAWRPEIQRRGK